MVGIGPTALHRTHGVGATQMLGCGVTPMLATPWKRGCWRVHARCHATEAVPVTTDTDAEYTHVSETFALPACAPSRWHSPSTHTSPTYLTQR